MQDIYTVITAAMLQALKDQIVYIQSAIAENVQTAYSSACNEEQKRITDGRGSSSDACADPYGNASAETVHILS